MKRIYLTPEIIDTFAEPKTGETWLADSAVPGFGVRIWHRNGKIGKAYAVRAADEYGRFNRIALRKWELQDIAQSSWRFALGEHAPTFGELLPEARLWARDQIDRLTGRPTLADERRDQWARSAEQAGKITLARAAAGVITTLELGGRSQVYRDRLDKLFSAYVPENLKKKPLVKITLAEIASVLRSPVLSYGNMRALRPFLGKCIDLVRQFHGRTHESLWDFERMIEIKVQTVEHPMVHWESSRFKELIRYLSQHDVWQQGLCLALYFETRNALSAAMAAHWDDFVDVRYISRMHVGQRPMWRREWRAGGRRGWGAEITVRANTIFTLIEERHASDVAEKVERLFPSRYGRQHSHIRSVDHVWRQTLAHFELPHIRPRLAHVLYDAALWGRWKPEDRLYVPSGD